MDLTQLFLLQQDYFPRYVLLNELFNRFLSVVKYAFNRTILKAAKPTRFQVMAYEYEAIRKLHTHVLTLGSRLLGMVLTARGFLGLMLKLMFFTFLQVTGLSRVIFLTPMRPAV